MVSNDEWRNRILDQQPLSSAIKEIVLDRTRVNMRLPVDAYIWSSMSVTEQQDTLFSMADQVIFSFESYVLTENLPPQEVSKEVRFDVDIFESAWQLWKYNRRNSKIFGWVTRKWPVKYGTHRHIEKASVVLEGKYVYPEAHGIAFSERLGQPIRWFDYKWQ